MKREWNNAVLPNGVLLGRVWRHGPPSLYDIVRLTFRRYPNNGLINKGGRSVGFGGLFFLNDITTDRLKDLGDEAHLSTKQPRAGTPPWFPSPYGDCRWPQYLECAPCTWP
jgi:hypothetical protein